MPNVERTAVTRNQELQQKRGSSEWQNRSQSKFSTFYGGCGDQLSKILDDPAAVKPRIGKKPKGYSELKTPKDAPTKPLLTLSL